jgi:DUF3040 family protein
MSLTPAERRALARIEDSLRGSDPGLAAMLATFALPGPRAKVAALIRLPRRITRARPLILAAIALATMCVIFISALQRGGGDPLCIPGAHVITGGQTLNCPPAAGPPAYRGRPARSGGTSRLSANQGAAGR